MIDTATHPVLRWTGYTGVAKRDGVAVTLTAAPNLGAGPVWTLDYRPAVDVLKIQPDSNSDPRRMQPREVEAAEALLRELTKDAPHEHDPTCGGPDHGDPAIWLRK